jgi:hypothetical protein
VKALSALYGPWLSLTEGVACGCQVAVHQLRLALLMHATSGCLCFTLGYNATVPVAAEQLSRLCALYGAQSESCAPTTSAGERLYISVAWAHGLQILQRWLCGYPGLGTGCAIVGACLGCTAAVLSSFTDLALPPLAPPEMAQLLPSGEREGR